jgi:hypothetical protein
LFVPSQDGWKPAPHKLKRLGGGQMFVKGNHPLAWDTCVNWVRKWASICGRGGIANV